MAYFILLQPATCVALFIGAIFKLKYQLLKRVIYTIGNTVVNCKISRYTFKIFQLQSYAVK